MAPRTPKTPEDRPAKPPKLRVATGQTGAGAKPTPADAEQVKPTLKVVEKGAVPSGAGIMKLKDLVEAVAAANGSKKPEAKKSVEATLKILAEALKSGTVLALPPLGKLRVAKAAGGTLTLKLRLADAARAGGKPLADDGEDS